MENQEITFREITQGNEVFRIPEIMGRLYKQRRSKIFEGGGRINIEISCPFCGEIHTHSPSKIFDAPPGYRRSHCSLSRYRGTYYIKGTYKGEPQKNQPKGWVNVRGETVEKVWAKIGR